MTSNLRTAKVLFKDKHAGRLEETATGGVRFIYHEEWTESIACCLPVTRREHDWRPGVHPFFQHLGAEGWLRERQARVAHLAEDDDFGLLLRYGADCIGAVGIVPENADLLIPVSLAEGTNPGRTVSGVQRKLLVVRDETLNAFRPADLIGLAPFIAKFNSSSIPTLVRNENLSLRWITAMLGPEEVTAFTVDRIAELDEHALVVTRFDRTATGQKLRAEDFAQILCKPRGRDYAGKYDASYEDVADVIRSHSARPNIDMARFFRRLVAYALVSNGDAHLKNFTLLERPEGLRLSPAYDVVNIGVYPEYSQQLALSIGGEYIMLEAITRNAISAFGARIGLSRATIAQTFRDLKSRARQANALLPKPAEGRDDFGGFFSDTVMNACLRLLEE
jgi:serine/threonine-protein kinase HipA